VRNRTLIYAKFRYVYYLTPLLGTNLSRVPVTTLLVYKIQSGFLILRNDFRRGKYDKFNHKRDMKENARLLNLENSY